MDAGTLLQQLANGIVNGSTYVLIATGVTLVFGVLRIVNFAHGEFFMLGAYVTFYAHNVYRWSYEAAALMAVIVVAAFGGLTYFCLFRPLRRHHEFIVLLSSLGLSLLLASLAEVLFGADPKLVGSPYADAVVQIGPIALTQQRMLVILAGALAMLGVYALLRYTLIGKMMRATAQNPDGAALTGINTTLVSAFTVVMAGGLAGLAGALVAPTAMLYPTAGMAAVLKGFIVVILGGLGSIPGAVVGGMLLGIVEALGGGYISQGFGESIGYLIVIAMLLWRPSGLFGRGAAR